MVRITNFLIASILMLATRSSVMSAPVEASSSGSGSNSLKPPPPKSNQASEVAAGKTSKVGESRTTSITDLPQDVLRSVGSLLSDFDKWSLRDSTKYTKETLHLSVRELYSIWLKKQSLQDKMTRDKNATVANLYSFCLSSFKETLSFYPTLNSCLDDVHTEVPDLISGMGAYGLVTAAMYNRADIVREMLVRGADPNLKVGDYLMPLLKASSYGNSEMTELLLKNSKHSADPNAVIPKILLTPLMLAAQRITPEPGRWSKPDHLKCAELLLIHGADKSKKDSGGRTALYYAMYQETPYTAMILLLNSAASQSSSTQINAEAQILPYNNAPVADRKAPEKKLSKTTPRVWDMYCSTKRIDPSTTKSGHLVDMYNFCLKKYPATLKLYPTVQACLDDVDKDVNELRGSEVKFKPHIVISDTPGIIREFLERGTAPDILTRWLWVSVAHGDAEMTEVLLTHPKHRVNPNKFPPGFAPLIAAVVNDHGNPSKLFNYVKCAELLLKHGADPKVKSQSDSRTAMEIAVANNNQPMVNLLSRYQ